MHMGKSNVPIVMVLGTVVAAFFAYPFIITRNAQKPSDGRRVGNDLMRGAYMNTGTTDLGRDPTVERKD